MIGLHCVLCEEFVKHSTDTNICQSPSFSSPVDEMFGLQYDLVIEMFR